jgi:hypothetical protein
VKRIYHTWDKWECYPAGLYETLPPEGMSTDQARRAYAEFLRDLPRFGAALDGLLRDWPHSCEHYLTNENMNRIAWLGQAAMCYATRVPAVFRSGFSLLSEPERDAANREALRALNVWLEARGEERVDLEAAGVAAKVNLY